MLKIKSVIQVRGYNLSFLAIILITQQVNSNQIQLSTETKLIHQEMHRGKVHHQNRNLERGPTNNSCDELL